MKFSNAAPTRRLLATVAKRLLVVVLLLLGVSIGVFALLYAAPGDPARTLLGNRPATAETLEAIRVKYNLDGSAVSQYLAWLRNALHFDFGESIRTQEPVSSLVLTRLGFSGQLALYSFVLTMLLGVPLGLLAALKRGRPADRAISAAGIVSSSTPAFVSGILLIYVFAVQLTWFQPFGEGEPGWDRFTHLTLPAVALSLSVVAIIIKLTRSAVVEVLEQDYVTFARARGLSERGVLVRYALRNAMIPVVTATGLVLGYLVTGAVLVEVTFDLPGIGSLLVDSVNRKDIPVVQGITIALALVVILINMSTDALYARIDPRVRLAGGRS